MSAALATAAIDAPGIPAGLAATLGGLDAAPQETAGGLENEARLGFEALRQMSPDQLRDVIDSRVQMLENVLKERELRREALDTAKLASKMLDMHQARSHTIRKNVNIGSAIAAVASTLLIIVVMV